MFNVPHTHICERWRQYQTLMLAWPWRHSESSPDLRWPRISRSTIVQLPCTCDPPSTDAVLSTDAHMKGDSLENRLLQLCTVRRNILHHSEAPASPEQRGAFRPHLSWHKVFYRYMIPDFDIVVEDDELWCTFEMRFHFRILHTTACTNTSFKAVSLVKLHTIFRTLIPLLRYTQ